MGSISKMGFIGAIVTAIVVAAAVYFSGGTVLAAVGWGAAAGGLSLVATSMMSQIGTQQYGDVTDTLSRSTSPTTGLPVLYGGQLPHKNGISGGSYILTGSIVSWYNVPGGDSYYLFSEQAVSYTGVEKHIQQIYIDNEPVLVNPVTEDGIVSNSSISSRFAPYLQLEVRFGGDYTTTKSLASQYAGPKWSNQFLGKGIVSISVVIFKTQDSLENNILTNDRFTLTAEMKGQVIYDLNTDTRFASSNPPSIIYDYLTNNIYGMSIDPALINIESFKETAAYCEQLEYYANGSVSYQSTYKENIEGILQSFGGIMFVHGGQICLTTDRKTLPVASFDESTMFGSVQLSTSGSTDYFNTIDAKWTNTESMYTTDVLRMPPDISTDEAIRSDGQIITLSRDYSWVYDKDTLARLVNVELRKGRYSLRTISFTTSEGWDLSVWDSITVTNEELAISGKFKVLSKNVSTDQENIGYVTISAVEYPDDIFDGTDDGVFSPGGVIDFPVLNVQPPSNVSVVRFGTITSGSAVSVSWTASQDPYIRGYNIYYKLSTASSWSYVGSTSTQKTDFEIYGLSEDEEYDFAVAAYNNLGLVSSKASLDGVIPTYNFALPSVTSVQLSNSTTSPYITDSSDFNITWDNQKDILINGRTFTDYFKYYQVDVYNGTEFIKSFYTQDNFFNFTLAINERKIRKPTIKISGRGYNSGTFSDEVSITVENKQCLAPTGTITFTGGFGNLFATWIQSTERDYAGAVINITSDTVSTLFVSNKPEFDSIPNIADGTYLVKMGFFDVFGQDNIQYSAEQQVIITSKYQFTESDASEIEDIIHLDDRLNETLNNAVNESNEYTNTQITIVQNNIDENITAQITEMNQTIVDNNNAQTQSIIQLKSEVDDQVATVNQLMETKADVDTVNSSYTLSVNANGTVAGFKLLASDGPASNSAIYFTADKFIITPSDGVTAGSAPPFSLVDGSVYLNTAIIRQASIGTGLIQDASITNLKLANGSVNTLNVVDGAITNAKVGNLQSNNFVNNTSGWQIDKAGSIQINGTGGTGRMTINNNIIQIWDNNNVLRVRMGLW
ncbi:fibronectin type III domain protein [Enterobacter sp. BIGb0383]|uniref:phage tail tip fiber protein n=1 Tax=unclassified Enterobacter TaxID=2608935 RepID=UPI000F4629DD|nr:MULTISPECIES: fibronectin type III domain-containing protein [unclassified Enterobacter]ROP61613.1 fibronectin type III domain protein [Enterobacter sp. BIGb0383]ROS11774.1 fibronectin type III domain protein [Enterobacter sp. BIGb0359]